jgi:hypothetical protein
MVVSSGWQEQAITSAPLDSATAVARAAGVPRPSPESGPDMARPAAGPPRTAGSPATAEPSGTGRWSGAGTPSGTGGLTGSGKRAGYGVTAASAARSAAVCARALANARAPTSAATRVAITRKPHRASPINDAEPR